MRDVLPCALFSRAALPLDPKLLDAAARGTRGMTE